MKIMNPYRFELNNHISIQRYRGGFFGRFRFSVQGASHQDLIVDSSLHGRRENGETMVSG